MELHRKMVFIISGAPANLRTPPVKLGGQDVPWERGAHCGDAFPGLSVDVS